MIGPGKLPLEIQIRTREMHEHAELGVAAHWRYKEGGRANPAYEQKIVWLRQMLEPGERHESDGDFLERVRSEVFEDRVYALSPRGEVIELPRGATPLDFAYHVHTDLGHRCRGAKVNGRMVPLNTPLANGDQVEIVTAKQRNPSRDWLVPSLGYLASPRNRSKVRAWFRKLDEEQNRQQGKQILERELQRLAIHSVTLPELIGEFHFTTAEQLYLAIGEGEINVAQISGAVQRRAKPQELPSPVPRRHAVSAKETSGITIEGVGDLLSTFARCCGPVPPESIAGYITLGRGVSIHREDCANFRRLQTTHPERVIAVEWGKQGRACVPDRRQRARVRPSRSGARYQRRARRLEDQHSRDERRDRRARRHGRHRTAHHGARPGGAVARAGPDPGAAERGQRAEKGIEAVGVPANRFSFLQRAALRIW